MTYPTRGVELIVPSNVELAITRSGYGVNFNRRGHDYEVRYHPSGLAITRDGVKIRRWDDLPANVMTIIIKSRGMLPGQHPT